MIYIFEVLFSIAGALFFFDNLFRSKISISLVFVLSLFFVYFLYLILSGYDLSFSIKFFMFFLVVMYFYFSGKSSVVYFILFIFSAFLYQCYLGNFNTKLAFFPFTLIFCLLCIKQPFFLGNKSSKLFFFLCVISDVVQAFLFEYRGQVALLLGSFFSVLIINRFSKIISFYIPLFVPFLYPLILLFVYFYLIPFGFLEPTASNVERSSMSGYLISGLHNHVFMPFDIDVFNVEVDYLRSIYGGQAMPGDGHDPHSLALYIVLCWGSVGVIFSFLFWHKLIGNIYFFQFKSSKIKKPVFFLDKYIYVYLLFYLVWIFTMFPFDSTVRVTSAALIAYLLKYNWLEYRLENE